MWKEIESKVEKELFYEQLKLAAAYSSQQTSSNKQNKDPKVEKELFYEQLKLAAAYSSRFGILLFPYILSPLLSLGSD